MKKMIFFASFFVLLCRQWVVAHPPEAVTIHYESETHILSIVVKHDTPNVEKHYIDEIKIERNGAELIVQEIAFQMNSDKQEAQYLITDLREGDELKITAHCNVYGKKTEVFRL